MGQQEQGGHKMRQGDKSATLRRRRNAARRQKGKPAGAGSQPKAPNRDMDPAERWLLAAMPLHAITTLHGETGLRERFAIETASLSSTQRERIEQALDLADRLHAGDRRQREPYLNHLLRVATRIISHYCVRDPDTICAALLHDSVEDHASDLAPGGSRQQALAFLAAQFGNRVADLVEAVTNPEHDPARDRHELAAFLIGYLSGRETAVSDAQGTLAVRCAVESDIGLRQDNEDSAYAGARLLAVAAGMAATRPVRWPAPPSWRRCGRWTLRCRPVSC
jgi:HD domain